MILHLSAMGRHQLKLQQEETPSELAEFTELSSDIKIQQERIFPGSDGKHVFYICQKCMELADHNGRKS